MSVNNDEWKTGVPRDSLKGLVLAFLRKNATKGFSNETVSEAVGHKIAISDPLSILLSGLNLWNVLNALESLVEDELVEKKEIFDFFLE